MVQTAETKELFGSNVEKSFNLGPCKHMSMMKMTGKESDVISFNWLVRKDHYPFSLDTSMGALISTSISLSVYSN